MRKAFASNRENSSAVAFLEVVAARAANPVFVGVVVEIPVTVSDKQILGWRNG